MINGLKLKDKRICICNNKMKTCTWVVKLYFDDDKKNLMFEKTYKNIDEIKTDFHMKKCWFYDIFRRKKREYKSYKESFKNKYRRMRIEKTKHTTDGDVVEIFEI